MRTMIVVTALSLCAGLPPAHAGGDVPPALSARLQALAPGMEPDHVMETGVSGMYEARFGSIIVYLSGDGRYMLRGDLIDLAAGRNLTEVTRRSMRAETVDALGEANMVVFEPEAVKHTVTVFRYTAFPRAGVGSNTWDKMVSVWCARDPHQAMTDAKAGIEIAVAKCDNPVRDQYEAGKAIGVTGTPAIVLESGELIPGYVPPEELADRLDERVSG